MAMPMIPLSQPTFGTEEAEAVRDTLASAWVSQGPMVKRFEDDLAQYVNTRHAIAVSSCTSALHLALLDIDLEPGDEVILPSFTFIATANVVLYCGAVPVFVDIDSDTLNIDPALVESAVTPKTRAILCVHQLGMPCNLIELARIAERHGLYLIEDAACALGSEVLIDDKWVKVGQPAGHMACFSFHGRKPISTGEGGMLTTQSAESARKLRLLRHHGMAVPDTLRHHSKEVTPEAYEVVGYNYRLSDIQAAVGVVQLQRLDRFILRRRAISELYSAMLADIPGLRTPSEPSWAKTNWQSYSVRLPAHAEQRAVVRHMRSSGVAARAAGVMCIHREPAYTNNPQRWRKGSDLAKSENAQDATILLPMYDALGEDDLERVVCTLREALGA